MASGAAISLTLAVALLFPTAVTAQADRALELVSPSGTSPRVLPGTGTSTPDGNVVCFDTENVTAGSDSNGEMSTDGFCSWRTSSGWETKWVTGPAVDDPKGNYGSAVFFVSSDGSRAVFASDKGIYPDYPGGPPDGSAGGNAPITAFMWEGDGMPRWLAPAPEPVRDLAFNRQPLAASEDLRHGVFQSMLQLVPEDANDTMDVYEWTPDGIRLVSRDDSGVAVGGAVPPNGMLSSNSTFAQSGAISRDGSRIFFQHAGSLPGSDPVYRSVYMRQGDQVRLVSPRRGGATPSHIDFVGASDDGEVVYLQTEEQLTPEPKEAGSAIYRYEVASDTLSLVATDPAGVTSLGLSGDGSTMVYQTAPGDFAGPWELRVLRDGVTSTLGDLDFMDVASSNYTVGDPVYARRALRISRDGDVVAFSSLGGFAGTAPGRKQVYRWTPERGVERVSVRSDGGPPAGDAVAELGNWSMAFGLVPRAVSVANTLRDWPLLGRVIADDGRVFFESSERLVAGDVNDYFDVYEWQDGTVRLISPGTQSANALYHDNSADGETVFFVTSARLIPELDRNTALDLYAARVGGGFPLAREVPCEGDACQGPPPIPPAGREKASVGFSGAGNVAGRRRATLSVARGKVRGATARLRVRVPAAGRVSVSGTRVRRASRAVAGARTVTVRVRLEQGARRTLARRGRLGAVVRVTFRRRSGGSTARTVRVAFKQPKAKRAAAAGSISKGGR